MKAVTIKNLSKLKTELLCKLFDSTNSKDQFIDIRNRFYRISYDLYFMKKKAKLAKQKQSAEAYLIPRPINNDQLLTLTV